MEVNAEYNVDALGIGIVAQACKDYYYSCLPPEKPTSVPRLHSMYETKSYRYGWYKTDLYKFFKKHRPKGETLVDIRKKVDSLYHLAGKDWDIDTWFQYQEIFRKARKKEVIDFFHSDWYQSLCNLDPEGLMKVIEERRAEDDRKKMSMKSRSRFLSNLVDTIVNARAGIV